LPTYSSEKLFNRAEKLKHLVDPCVLCPRQCKARRLHNEKGFCKLTDSAVMASAIVHFGEEPPITGHSGSGTVFLSGCNASCIFCQNYQISQMRIGKRISSKSLADEFLKLQDKGCENINWVTPTPHLPFLLEALAIAVEKGLNLPLVYNTNSYMRLEILEMLEGVVNIYLPDMKYGENIWAESFSNMTNYFEISVAAVTEMVHQVGSLQLNQRGVAEKGVLVRHLVLPEGTSGSQKIFKAIANINPQIPVSIMAQYNPCFKAIHHPILGRRITKQEYQNALDDFKEAGLKFAYTQKLEEMEIEDFYFPDFKQNNKNIFGLKKSCST